MKPTAIQLMIEAIQGEVRSSNIGNCPDFAWKTSLEILLEEARRLAEIEAEEKPQADAGLVDTDNSPELYKWADKYDIHGRGFAELRSILIGYCHPAHSTTDIVGEIDKVLHEPCLAIDAWRKVERAKEVIRKFSNEKGGCYE